mmetsp:Transcript_1054/g.1641  ORF Transcript_1054/g.1641 Transcript_1054/m.1641 type:complete len:145 (-) Transcript_1054:143-577(-)
MKETEAKERKHSTRFDPVLTNKELSLIQNVAKLRNKLQEMIVEKDMSEDTVASQELLIGDLLNANQLIIKRISYYLKEGEGKDELTTGIVQNNTEELIDAGKNLAQVVRSIQSLCSTMEQMPPMQFDDLFIRLFLQNPGLIFQN